MLYVLLGLCVFAACVLHPLHWIAAGLFLRKLNQPLRVGEVASWPRASVLVCVRGADPSLHNLLEQLTQQDYPDYEIRVVVDSTADPAWPMLQAWSHRWSQRAIDVQPLQRRLKSCSGKCSKLVQMIDTLDERTEVIALCDCDVELTPDWLRKLVAPLDDPTVGAVTAIRWFRPRVEHFGSLLRKLWSNLSTLSQAIGNFPWGGSLAIRRSAFDAAGLADLWRHAMVDDTPVRTALAKLGLRTYATPELIVTSSEECTLSFAYNFVTRQLLWQRLYEPIWPWIPWHALDTLGAAAFPPVLAGVGYLAQEPLLMFVSFGLVALYLLSFLLLMTVLDRAVARRGATHDGSSISDEPFSRRWCRWQANLLGLIVLPYFHISAVNRAAKCRLVTWRGITYRVAGPTQVEMVDASTESRLITSRHSI